MWCPVACVWSPSLTFAGRGGEGGDPTVGRFSGGLVASGVEAHDGQLQQQCSELGNWYSKLLELKMLQPTRF